jgi:hypothetical protein
MLADMISDKPILHPFMARYQIKTKRRSNRRAPPKKPETIGRDYFLGTVYEGREIGSDAAFEAIAKAVGMSVQTVRQAITSRRKRNAHATQRLNKS